MLFNCRHLCALVENFEEAYRSTLVGGLRSWLQSDPKRYNTFFWPCVYQKLQFARVNSSHSRAFLEGSQFTWRDVALTGNYAVLL